VSFNFHALQLEIFVKHNTFYVI